MLLPGLMAVKNEVKYGPPKYCSRTFKLYVRATILRGGCAEKLIFFLSLRILGEGDRQISDGDLVQSWPSTPGQISYPAWRGCPHVTSKNFARPRDRAKMLCASAGCTFPSGSSDIRRGRSHSWLSRRRMCTCPPAAKSKKLACL